MKKIYQKPEAEIAETQLDFNILDNTGGEVDLMGNKKADFEEEEPADMQVSSSLWDN